MKPILLIIGSPASGKSTISKEIAKRSPKGLHIPVDDLRTMVQGGVIHPNYEWHPELIQQLALARQTAIDMSIRYCESDFLVAIDDFWDPYSKLQEYGPLLDRPNVIKIILRPSVNTTLARLHARQATTTFLDDAIELINASLDRYQEVLIERGWHVIDTSHDTIEASVVRILALLETSTG